MIVILGGFFYGLLTDSVHTGVFAGLTAFGSVLFAAALVVLPRRT